MSKVIMDESVIQWLSSRRSIRRYSSRPVPREILYKLLEGAIWAPSAHNRQPWRFIVLTDQDNKQKLATAMGQSLKSDLEVDGLPVAQIEADVNRSYRRLVGAPVIIVVALCMADMDNYPDKKRQQNEWIMAVQSTAMAGQNLLLSAHAFGLGACWMCAPLFCQEVVKEVLSLDACWQPLGLVTIGYPNEVRSKPRRPVEDVVVFTDSAKRS